MMAALDASERRTSADIVFDQLYDEIVGLDLLPGAKMSEVEVAKRFGISRQPVRDAFSRLSNLGLLIVRPQRSTVVRHFSMDAIQNARFIRIAVEAEVLRRACAQWDDAHDVALQENLDAQARAIEAEDAEAFHRLDYEFHRLLCQGADAAFAFETIAANKAQVDRLCMLSLTSRGSMAQLHRDHLDIMAAIRDGDRTEVDRAIRLHLSRIQPTIEAIYESHRDYFES